MDIVVALVLGLIQGVTEWLPVSSTGHLVLAQEFMNLPATDSVMFDLLLHAATLLSVVIFLRKDLRKIVSAMLGRKEILNAEGLASRRLGWLALFATAPAIVAGLLLSRYLEEIFTPAATAISLLVTGAMLWAAEMPQLRKERKEINIKDALIIGCFQAVSVVPGISRSGSTIASGCYLGLQRQIVAVFSFVLSIPIIILALGYNAMFLADAQIDLLPTALATTIAFVAGLLALKLLFGMIRKFKLRAFSVYCWAVGALVLFLVSIQNI